VRKIGLYGGTFDPIHNAHLILAREALEQLQLERVIFIPAAASPHKLEQGAAPAAIRAEMLRAAIAGENAFAVDELELLRPPPSFTIDTVEAFHRRSDDTEIHYLIGSDNLPRLHTWHRFDELAKLVRFVVLERSESHSHAQFTTIRRPIDISATEIRNRVATGRSVRYLVPAAVEEIIRSRALYKEPQKSPRKN